MEGWFKSAFPSEKPQIVFMTWQVVLKALAFRGLR
jgi:hypothetical protein